MGVLLLIWVAAAATEPPEVRFDRLVRQVRDGSIDREAARDALRSIVAQAADASRERCPADDAGGRWIFPIAGYGPSDIGGRKGNGYKPGSFDFFEGNRHRGHPAHDIFIRDRDQDGLDDATRLPVPVVSVSMGIVVSLEQTWEPGSPLRGGRYVCVLDAETGRLYYYAHLQKVAVDLGACVTAGSVLGTVGRTGASANPRRSPTHLHFMALEVCDGLPLPWNPWKELRAARRLPAPAAPAEAAATTPPGP